MADPFLLQALRRSVRCISNSRASVENFCWCLEKELLNELLNEKFTFAGTIVYELVFGSKLLLDGSLL